VPNSELVFQSFELPVPVDDLKAVRFVFDQSISGVVDLDDMAIRPGDPGAR